MSEQRPTLLRLREVKQRTGLSRTTIYASEGKGKFPRRVVIGPRAVAWVEAEIDQWITDRIEERQ
jgi:prophage regulatory protein